MKKVFCFTEDGVERWRGEFDLASPLPIPPTPPVEKRYRCTGAPDYMCVEDPNGPYADLASCQAECKKPLLPNAPGSDYNKPPYGVSEDNLVRVWDESWGRKAARIGKTAFWIPEGRTALKVDVVGTTNDTKAEFTWTFPDGRVFPDTQYRTIMGPGTSSITLKIRSQSSFAPTIQDEYIPMGWHVMEITGRISGNMSVGF